VAGLKSNSSSQTVCADSLLRPIKLRVVMRRVVIAILIQLVRFIMFILT
jgi:hypothetical protein